VVQARIGEIGGEKAPEPSSITSERVHEKWQIVFFAMAQFSNIFYFSFFV